MALALLTPGAAAGEYGDVAAVAPRSAAARAGLSVGDRLLSINGHRLRDAIDFRFYAADDELELLVHRGATERTVRLWRRAGEPLGLELAGSGLAAITECNNHCPFCFVTQLPPGMRRTLHIKDDDYRYSFLFANFVTLTNLRDEDWARIAEQHLSPLYVSVHSTDVRMRRKLLGNRFAGDPLEQLDRLNRLDITVHTQLVLCPGINDGADLERSVTDLLSRYPGVQTIAAVPVGLTRVRTERTMSRGMPLRTFTPAEAARVVDFVEAAARPYLARYGVPVVYASDELYLVAGRPVPPAEHYDDLSQLENGVGMVRQLLDDWAWLKSRLPAALPRPRRLTMACATLIAPILNEIVREMNGIGNLNVDLRVVRNQLFGAEVTVSGLIGGRDLMDALADATLGDTVVLPRDMFDHTGTLTLDDVNKDELSRRTERPIRAVKRLKELYNLLIASPLPPDGLGLTSNGRDRGLKSRGVLTGRTGRAPLRTTHHSSLTTHHST